MLHIFTAPSITKLSRLLAKVGVALPQAATADLFEGRHFVSSKSGHQVGLVLTSTAAPATFTAALHTGPDAVAFAPATVSEVA